MREKEGEKTDVQCKVSVCQEVTEESMEDAVKHSREDLVMLGECTHQ